MRLIAFLLAALMTSGTSVSAATFRYMITFDVTEADMWFGWLYIDSRRVQRGTAEHDYWLERLLPYSSIRNALGRAEVQLTMYVDSDNPPKANSLYESSARMSCVGGPGCWSSVSAIFDSDRIRTERMVGPDGQFTDVSNGQLLSFYGESFHPVGKLGFGHDGGGWAEMEVNDVAEFGTIDGHSYSWSMVYGTFKAENVRISAVPLPAGGVLLVSGLGLLAWRGRRGGRTASRPRT